MRVKKLDPEAKLPTIANPGEDLGYDIYALESIKLYQNKVTEIRTGIAIDPGPKFGLIIKDRSSMAKMGIRTSGGVIDSGYRGEVIVLMTFNSPNLCHEFYQIKAGQKIAQMVPQYIITETIEEVSDLSESKRGTKGFGSSNEVDQCIH
jgi:dUTP pyrophosphatase